MPLDILTTLPPPSWRGIPFPLTSLHNAFTHDHVEHKFMYMAGANIEVTGRNAFNFQVRIPFHNGAKAAPFEPWSGQTLYPDLFDKFLAAVLDGSTGEFVHPNFGPLQCKARDVDWEFISTGARDGATISCRFYQTIDELESLADTLTPGSALGQATASADVLDSELEKAGPLPELANDKSTFSSMIGDYKDGKSGLGRVNSKLDSTSSALDRLDDVGFWPLRAATEDMRAAVFDLGRNPATNRGSVREFQVPFLTSIPGLAIRLGVKTDDLVRMNPSLAREPGVPPGTRVRYPQSGT